MNTVTHVLAAGVLAETVSMYGPECETQTSRRRAVLAAVIGGAVSHLMLDAVPHFNWISHLNLWNWLPYHWVLRSAIWGVFAAMPMVAFASRKYVTCSAIAGALFPDVEKVAHTEFRFWPSEMLVFKSHGMRTTSYDGGMPYPLLVLIDVICGLGLVGAVVVLRRRNRKRLFLNG